jgi:hypothetical protein
MSDPLDLILRQSRPVPPVPSGETVARARAAALDVASRFRRARRIRVGLVLAATGLCGLLISPVGIGGELGKLLSGTPAPAPIQESFAGLDNMRASMFAYAAAAGHELHDRYSKVIADAAVHVTSIGTVDGPVDLWAAPTEDGRQCWLIQTGTRKVSGQPSGLSTCEGREPVQPIAFDSFWTDELPDVAIVHVRLYEDRIVQVDLTVERGQDRSLPVTEGHALGWIPHAARVVGAVGRDVDGEVVARWSASG